MITNLWLINTIDDFNTFTLNGGKVVIIADDPDPYIRNNPAAVMGSILLPSYRVISAEIDGQYAESDAMYWEELSREEASDYFISVLAALYSGIPIAFYFGKEEFDMRFIQSFLQFIYQVYGMVPGFGNTRPEILDSYSGENLDKIYYMNLMRFDQYIVKRPGVSHNWAILNKMVQEVQPLVPDYQADTIIKFFEKLKKDVDELGIYYPYPFKRIPGEEYPNL